MNNKFSEFMTVLLTALVFGAAAWATFMYVGGAAQKIVLVVLLILVIIAFRVLRRRYGRE